MDVFQVLDLLSRHLRCIAASVCVLFKVWGMEKGKVSVGEGDDVDFD
jgi:hypothetical protein